MLDESCLGGKVSGHDGVGHEYRGLDLSGYFTAVLQPDAFHIASQTADVILVEILAVSRLVLQHHINLGVNGAFHAIL